MKHPDGPAFGPVPSNHRLRCRHKPDGTLLTLEVIVSLIRELHVPVLAGADDHLTLTTTHRPATDLGYLLHKNPARCQTFSLSFGQAHVLFYPEAGEDRCTAALLLDVDPVAMVRGHGGVWQTVLAQYVNGGPRG
ncbi:MAG: hypothetical protein ACLP9L_02565 [Thermoguttaceae bacterium]